MSVNDVVIVACCYCRPSCLFFSCKSSLLLSLLFFRIASQDVSPIPTNKNTVRFGSNDLQHNQRLFLWTVLWLLRAVWLQIWLDRTRNDCQIIQVYAFAAVYKRMNRDRSRLHYSAVVRKLPARQVMNLQVMQTWKGNRQQRRRHQQQQQQKRPQDKRRYRPR